MWCVRIASDSRNAPRVKYIYDMPHISHKNGSVACLVSREKCLPSPTYRCMVWIARSGIVYSSIKYSQVVPNPASAGWRFLSVVLRSTYFYSTKLTILFCLETQKLCLIWRILLMVEWNTRKSYLSFTFSYWCRRERMLYETNFVPTSSSFSSMLVAYIRSCHHCKPSDAMGAFRNRNSKTTCDCMRAYNILFVFSYLKFEL